VHLIIRDNFRSGYLIRIVSRDHGASWGKPLLTNYPDATSKNFTGRLSGGWYFLINNPDQKQRDPLAISLSRDGWIFERPMAIRSRPPQCRYTGRAKGSGTVQYPHAIEHNGSLWVIYSTNKEDIEVSELPLHQLVWEAAR
jgi:predicted neuraminidase